jgi:2-polyprenyl-6-methoxyphenol hydroxylase-like FAD-dependent oxidoreductase
MERYDFVIVGGGLTGASLAAALAARGTRSILVLEARAGKNPRFAGELIHPTGVDVLDDNRLLAPLRADGGVDVLGFAVVRAPEASRWHPATLLPYGDIPGGRATGLAIEHHAMVARLRAEAAARPGVELRTGARVVDVLREGDRVVGVRTADGEEIRAGLTLVAEGRHSKLREAVGIAASARLLSYTAAVLVERTALPHPRHGHIFLGAPGPILAYPIAEEQGQNTVRMCIDLPALDEKGTDAVARRIADAYARYVPEPLRSGMLRSLAERPVEMAANWAISTGRCTAPGIALVGESNGCCHPLTAAGMTVCLTDIRILVEEVDAARGEAEALQRYQQRRYRFVRAREVLADALYEVFRGDDEGARAIRNGIFRYWDGSERARATSMALLSGADSRLGTFLGEYLRVVGRSTGGALRGEVNEPSLWGRARSLRGLAGKSLDKLRVVAGHVREGTMR